MGLSSVEDDRDILSMNKLVNKYFSLPFLVRYTLATFPKIPAK